MKINIKKRIFLKLIFLILSNNFIYSQSFFWEKTIKLIDTNSSFLENLILLKNGDFIAINSSIPNNLEFKDLYYIKYDKNGLEKNLTKIINNRYNISCNFEELSDTNNMIYFSFPNNYKPLYWSYNYRYYFIHTDIGGKINYIKIDSNKFSISDKISRFFKFDNGMNIVYDTSNVNYLYLGLLRFDYNGILKNKTIIDSFPTDFFKTQYLENHLNENDQIFLISGRFYYKNSKNQNKVGGYITRYSPNENKKYIEFSDSIDIYYKQMLKYGKGYILLGLKSWISKESFYISIFDSNLKKLSEILLEDSLKVKYNNFALDKNNRIILVGNSYNYNNSLTSYIIKIIDLNGKLLAYYNFNNSEEIKNLNYIISTDNSYIIGGNIGNKIYLAKISDILGIELNFGFENIKIQINPNPASDYIEIKNVISNEMRNPVVETFNIFGEKESTSVNYVDTSASGGHLRIDISNLPAGVYFIKIGDKFEKFVKL